MAKTEIEWADESWNPIVGCSLVSPGCTNCYAMSMAARIEKMGAAKGNVPHYAGLTQPSKAGPVWTGKLAAAPDHVWWAPVRAKKPRVYFVNSMGDLFHEAVPDAWIDRAFAMMALAPQHTFIVLTKRAERMWQYMTGPVYRPRRKGAEGQVEFPGGLRAYLATWLVDMLVLDECPDSVRVIRDNNWPLDDDAPIGEPRLRHWPLPNVVLGVSVEDQTRANERVPDLLATPAATRVISAEPLLGPVDLTAIGYNDGYVDSLRGDLWGGSGTGAFERGIDAVIVGGESGQGARPMHPDWARSLRDQCAGAGVDFFFKQWGNWHPSGERLADGSINCADMGERPGFFHEWPGGGWSINIGKPRAGRFLDGITHDALPWRKAEG